MFGRRNITKRKDCRQSCYTCTLCQGRNYDWCLDACQKCYECTTPNPFKNAYGYPPRLFSYSGNWGYDFHGPLYSPNYGVGVAQNTTYYTSPYKASLYPGICDSKCGYKLCEEWREKMRDFNHCLRSNTREDCLEKHGCRSWRGYAFRKVPPINPMRTNCQACWKSGFIF